MSMHQDKDNIHTSHLYLVAFDIIGVIVVNPNVLFSFGNSCFCSFHVPYVSGVLCKEGKFKESLL